MYPHELAEGLVDEDEGDEDGKDLLGEAGDVSDQEAALDSHDDHHYDHQPQTHPDAAHYILQVLRLAKLLEGIKKRLSKDQNMI